MGDKCVEGYISAVVSRGINERDMCGQTALINMARVGRFPMAERCLKELLKIPGIDVNIQDNSGMTALTWAVTFSGADSSVACVEALLKHPNIDVNLCEKKIPKRTCLHFSVDTRTMDLKALDLLLQHPSINVNVKDSDGDTPLANLFMYDHLDITNRCSIATKLLEHPKIEVNSYNKNGRTPLHIMLTHLPESFNQTHFDLCKALVTRPETRLNTVNNSGRSPLAVLCKKEFNNPAVKQYLDLMMTQPNISVYTALKACNYPTRWHIGQYILDHICRRLKENSVRKLTLCSISDFGQKYLDKLKTALCETTRLRIFGIEPGLSNEEMYAWREVSEDNFSVTDFHLRGCNMEYSNGILMRASLRNQRALEKCRAASLFTVWAFSKKLKVKDVARILGKLVWESRGTKTWVDE